MRQYKNHIMTTNSITLIFNDGSVLPLSSNSARFNAVRDALTQGNFQDACDYVDAASLIARKTKGVFEVVNGCVMIDNEDLPPSLSDRLLAFIEQDIETTPLVNYWLNLRDNPNPDSKASLFDYNEANDSSITVDGCFIAFKRINDQFRDHFTDTVDWSPGSRPHMNRKDCDEDRNNTCSKGLHVATFNYAMNAFRNGPMVEVKVNPRDVVAVPFEYHSEKMRVCDCEVIKVCDGPREEVEIIYTDDDSYQFIEDDDNDHLHEIDDNDNDNEVAVATETDGQTVIQLLKIGTNERLRIPSILIRQLGADSGDSVYATTIEGALLIYNFEPTDSDDVSSFTVDKYCNVLISRKVISQANILNTIVNFTANGDAQCIRIEPS